MANSSDVEELQRQWEAYMAFKYAVRMVSHVVPELMPLFEDLHRGSRGYTPVDWWRLAELTTDQPRTSFRIPDLDPFVAFGVAQAAWLGQEI